MPCRVSTAKNPNFQGKFSVASGFSKTAFDTNIVDMHVQVYEGSMYKDFRMIQI